MSVAESGFAWLRAVLIAPFVAVLFGAIGKISSTMYQAAHIEDGGEFAQAQESVFHNSMLALDLVELASSIETWILFGTFLIAVYTALQSRSSGF
ncbi:hypothetical protein HZS55_22050 [Halosimplex rubrum]|uniref:Uncharacterized protein n=1 Tax=Halosimplex rubrum TaxID=869889 RepID=A0A7D5T0T9_9EURY|nr:hypothetical protein [Halosimplex rubrum]QLH79811.1 hypothetical protein HZS55_22050 [Halosimplex rubrum]